MTPGVDPTKLCFLRFLIFDVKLECLYITHERSFVSYEMAQLNSKKWKNHVLTKKQSFVGSTLVVLSVGS